MYLVIVRVVFCRWLLLFYEMVVTAVVVNVVVVVVVMKMYLVVSIIGRCVVCTLFSFSSFLSPQ